MKRWQRSPALGLCAGLALVVSALAPLASVVMAATANVSETNSLTFQPDTIVINVGDTVMWTNTSTGIPHTTTSDTGLWDSGTMNPGATFSHTFTAPGTYLYHCTFHVNLGMVGSIIVAPLNSNTSFEIDANGDGTPDGWSRSGLTGVDTLVNDPNTGSRAFQISGSSTATKVLFQRLVRSGSAGQSFTISGWSKDTGASSSGGSYGVALRFENTDGTTSIFVAPFSKSTHGYQRTALTVMAPKAFRAVSVAALYQRQTGTATFDDVTLTTP